MTGLVSHCSNLTYLNTRENVNSIAERGIAAPLTCPHRSSPAKRGKKNLHIMQTLYFKKKGNILFMYDRIPLIETKYSLYEVNSSTTIHQREHSARKLVPK